jgi:hypothetical protein
MPVLKIKTDNGWEELSSSSVGDDNVNNAVLYTEQTLTPEQQAQARENIRASSYDEVAQKSQVQIITWGADD